jgi:hypothetical protein
MITGRMRRSVETNRHPTAMQHGIAVGLEVLADEHLRQNQRDSICELSRELLRLRLKRLGEEPVMTLLASSGGPRHITCLVAYRCCMSVMCDAMKVGSQSSYL